MAHALRRWLWGTTDALGRSTNPLLFAGHGLRYKNRKLQVILTETIDKLGKAGETVMVAPGHFRNHLMPKMLAVPNIPKYEVLIREQRKLYQREEEKVEGLPEVKDDASQENKMKEYETAAKRLNSARLSLKRHITEGNDLREPVTKEEIVAEVAQQLLVNIFPENLHMPSPLTSLGEHEVLLRLPREIPRPVGMLQWTLNVKIRRK
ncbi:50S ribosomal protein L9, chloroplastic [Apostasia shenzhenica]|uniref:Large ribosomal subunit protein bL9c n=1 Tax=Apostasia shenzhenica TaxID=1088818 RepID=A0A2I0BEV1_9ASPA|nr:50S ribosomal protein L9, chloroplastic [Apostasia shenzhenica]